MASAQRWPSAAHRSMGRERASPHSHREAQLLAESEDLNGGEQTYDIRRLLSPKSGGCSASPKYINRHDDLVARRCPSSHPSADDLFLLGSPTLSQHSHYRRQNSRMSDFMESHEVCGVGSPLNTFGRLPAEVIFSVCFFLDAPQLLRLGSVCRYLYHLVARHPVWKDFVIKNYGFKFENFVQSDACIDCDPSTVWRLTHDKIQTFLYSLRHHKHRVYTFPRLLADVSKVGPPQLEGCHCLTNDCNLLVWQNDLMLSGIGFQRRKDGINMKAEILWKQNLSLFGVKNPTLAETCLVLAPQKVFLFIDRKLLVFNVDTGDFISEVQNGDGGSWGVALDPSLDVSLRNRCVALLCNDVINILNVDTLQHVFTLKCGKQEQEVIWQRVFFVRSLALRMTHLRLERIRRAMERAMQQPRPRPQEETEEDLQLLTPLAGTTPENMETDQPEDLLDEMDVDVNDTTLSRPSTDFIWAGYRCVSGPKGRPCADCSKGLTQSVSCKRESEYIAVWFRGKSPRVWLYDGRTGNLKHLINCSDPDVTEEWESFNRTYGCNTFSLTRRFLAAPCVTRVKQTPNLSDPKHFFLATLDGRGTIRLFDSARAFAPLAVIRSGDHHTLRLSLSPTMLFTVSVADEDPAPIFALPNSPSAFPGQVTLRFWRFNQPSICDSLIISPTNRMNGGALREERPLRFCMPSDPIPPSAFERQQNMVHDKENRSTPTHSPASTFENEPVLEWVGECHLSAAVYLCDVIDSTYLAVWYSIPKKGGDEGWCLSMSDWKVFIGSSELLRLPNSSSLQYNQSPMSKGPLGEQIFSMKSRCDTWSLLDWRSLVIEPDGTLHVYDFCPISSKQSMTLD